WRSLFPIAAVVGYQTFSSQPFPMKSIFLSFLLIGTTTAQVIHQRNDSGPLCKGDAKFAGAVD
ncbi:MAG: hypothetical protein ACI9NQ_001828, partial [Paracoccaceae bacterium]